MAKRKRRIRSPHPGVWLKRRSLPSGLVTWRAHYLDPDTEREATVTLDAGALPTKEARELWAKRLAADLSRRRMERAAGVEPPPEPVTIDDAIELYLTDARPRLRDKTLVTYGLALAHLRAWARRERVTLAADLTAARLASLRAWLVRAPKRRAKAGAKRGTYARTAAKRSPVSVNRDLRTLATVLTSWRRAGLVPLSSDEIADGLRRLPQNRELPVFLAPADLRRLFAAALRHDAETFAMTREEHDGLRPAGSTARHPVIAPFVAVSLLTGMRRGEALGLRWADVDLEALDASGTKVGEVRLRAAATKTKTARIVGLEVSPGLRRILAAMKLRAGDEERVFRALSADMLGATRDRLVRSFGAPSAFGWQVLRSTASTFLVNAPGIYGGASAFLAARQLGHSVVVAEKRYAGQLRGIARDARTLEAAMQIEGELAAVLGALGARAPAARRATR